MLLVRRKALVLAAGLVMSVLTVSSSQAQFLSQIGSMATSLLGGGESASFKQKEKKFSKFLGIGTVNLLRAVANMQKAVGNRELAEQILLQAKNLKEAADKGEATVEDYKKASDTINESEVDRESFAKVPENRGRLYAGKSALSIALAGAADSQAIIIANSLATTPPSATDLLDLVKGGVKSTFDLATMAVKTLPDHIKKVSKWGIFVEEYMASHDIKPLTDEEKKKAAMDDGATEEETNEMFSS